MDGDTLLGEVVDAMIRVGDEGAEKESRLVRDLRLARDTLMCLTVRMWSETPREDKLDMLPTAEVRGLVSAWALEILNNGTLVLTGPDRVARITLAEAARKAESSHPSPVEHGGGSAGPAGAGIALVPSYPSFSWNRRSLIVTLQQV